MSEQHGVLERIEDELALCQICSQRMNTKNVPRILSCLHSFCEACLGRMAKDNAIACPICRTTTPLTPQGVRGLARNFTLVRMLEILEIKESKKFDCDDCDEHDPNNPAIMRCIDCSKFLCKECARFHLRRRDTKSHDLMTIKDFKAKAKELHTPKESVSLWCLKHQGEQLRLYCETCDTLICRDCTMIDHTRPEHRYVFVHEAGDHHRRALESALLRAQQQQPLAEDLIRKANAMILEVNGRARDVESEVRACLQQQRYQLLMREEQLVTAIESLRLSKEKMLLSHKEALELFLGNVHSACEFTQRILTEGTAAEVLATKVQILRQLNALSRKEINDKLPVDASIHFFANTQAFTEIINNFAAVTVSSSFPPLCQAVGEGLKFSTVGVAASFTVITFDTQGEKRNAGGDIISVRLEHPIQEEDELAASVSDSASTFDENMAITIQDNSNGTYDVEYIPTKYGEHVYLHVTIQSTPISNSPFSISIKPPIAPPTVPVPLIVDSPPHSAADGAPPPLKMNPQSPSPKTKPHKHGGKNGAAAADRRPSGEEKQAQQEKKQAKEHHRGPPESQAPQNGKPAGDA